MLELLVGSVELLGTFDEAVFDVDVVLLGPLAFIVSGVLSVFALFVVGLKKERLNKEPKLLLKKALACWIEDRPAFVSERFSAFADSVVSEFPGPVLLDDTLLATVGICELALVNNGAAAAAAAAD